MSETLTIDAPGAACPSPDPGQPPAINPPVRRFAAAVRDCCRGFPGWARYQMAGPATIVVLGMHRSGTSCITRMVHLCGASRRDSMVGANAFNKAGHCGASKVLAL